jgi:ATP-dependent DNA helicase RecQ
VNQNRSIADDAAMTDWRGDLPPESGVTAAAHAVAARWRAGDRADPALRADVARALAELRRDWQKQPQSFDAEVLALLKDVSRQLAAPAVPPDAPERALREIFGYSSFRPGQKQIIDALLAGRDCVGVMPTGAGKSLTYQIPARILGGISLVVSPLVALMKDQVDGLDEVGMRATYLSSTLEPAERERRIRGLAEGAYELCYAAPEGIEASVGRVLSGLDLRFIAVDEAHCISHWGHDFRPAYRNLAGLKRRFGAGRPGGIPVLALTATATPEVTADIVRQLAMDRPAVYRGSFFRPNLHLSAYRKGDGAENGGVRGQRGERGTGGRGVRDAIVRLVAARRGVSGIVYAISRKACESLAEHLRDRGVRAAAYHAGLEPAQRTAVQDGFSRDEIDVVVATIAFGMGIDKSNIRYVIHRDMPRSIESYYQEIGRAGRDGMESDCVLFYSWADVMAQDRFSEGLGDEVDSTVAARQREQVRDMFRLAAGESGERCRHRAIVRHLGEAIADCGASCDVCAGWDRLAESEPLAPTSAGRSSRAGKGEASAPTAALTSEDVALADRLKALRKRLATERAVPAYVVFNDATLFDLVAQRPRTAEALLAVSGIGPKKIELYGMALLEILAGP